jgi:hypothetical protein
LCCDGSDAVLAFDFEAEGDAVDAIEDCVVEEFVADTFPLASVCAWGASLPETAELDEEFVIEFWECDIGCGALMCGRLESCSSATWESALVAAVRTAGLNEGVPVKETVEEGFVDVAAAEDFGFAALTAEFPTAGGPAVGFWSVSVAMDDKACGNAPEITDARTLSGAVSGWVELGEVGSETEPPPVCMGLLEVTSRETETVEDEVSEDETPKKDEISEDETGEDDAILAVTSAAESAVESGFVESAKDAICDGSVLATAPMETGLLLARDPAIPGNSKLVTAWFVLCTGVFTLGISEPATARVTAFMLGGFAALTCDCGEADVAGEGDVASCVVGCCTLLAIEGNDTARFGMTLTLPEVGTESRAPAERSIGGGAELPDWLRLGMLNRVFGVSGGFGTGAETQSSGEGSPEELRPEESTSVELRVGALNCAGIAWVGTEAGVGGIKEAARSDAEGAFCATAFALGGFPGTGELACWFSCAAEVGVVALKSEFFSGVASWAAQIWANVGEEEAAKPKRPESADASVVLFVGMKLSMIAVTVVWLCETRLHRCISCSKQRSNQVRRSRIAERIAESSECRFGR